MGAQKKPNKKAWMTCKLLLESWAPFCPHLAQIRPNLSKLAKVLDKRGKEGIYFATRNTDTDKATWQKERWGYNAFCFYYIYYGFSCSPFLCATHPVEEVNY